MIWCKEHDTESLNTKRYDEKKKKYKKAPRDNYRKAIDSKPKPTIALRQLDMLISEC